MLYSKEERRGEEMSRFISRLVVMISVVTLHGELGVVKFRGMREFLSKTLDKEANMIFRPEISISEMATSTNNWIIVIIQYVFAVKN
jgi:hypothetical protein